MAARTQGLNGRGASFDDLLARAAGVRYMPFERSGREAYMAASEA